MELGIFAKTFPRPTLEQTLDAVASHGITHVQFNMSCVGLPTLPDKLDEGSCVWIAQMLHERGLKMAAISGTFNMVDPNESRLEHNLRRLEALAAACRWLDTRIITLCTGSLHSRDMWKTHPDNARKTTWDRMVESMRAAVKIADRHEVTLAFEPEINNVASSTMRARKLLDEVASPWLKVVIDPASLVHAGEMGHFVEILDDAFDWIGSDIVLAHAKEPVLNETDQKARAFFLAIHFYYPYFTTLDQLNYRGAIIIHGLGEEEVASRISQVRAALGASVKEGETDVGASA
jgi:sugar phosphate isomerase/epimerase